MGFIYKIVNQLNNKIYIGQTCFTIEKRWEEHKKEKDRKKYENVPFYLALKKYGVENFTVEMVEECDNSLLNEKEIYWINFYQSFIRLNKGYNATYGGEGYTRADGESIISLYKEGKTYEEITRITGHDHRTIKKWLLSSGISEEQIKENLSTHMSLAKGKPVALIDDNDNIIKVFCSSAEAVRYCNGKSMSKVNGVCNGKAKTAYGHKWKFISKEEYNEYQK